MDVITNKNDAGEEVLTQRALGTGGGGGGCSPSIVYTRSHQQHFSLVSTSSSSKQRCALNIGREMVYSVQ